MVYGKVFENVSSDRKLERTITAQRESHTISRAPTPVDEPDAVAVPLLPPVDVEHDPLTRRVTVVVRLSLVVNIVLLLVKAFVFLSTQSKAVLASLSDRCCTTSSVLVSHPSHPSHSVVDILCQLIIFWADHARNNAHRHYPIGMHLYSLLLCVHAFVIHHRTGSTGNTRRGAVLRDHVARLCSRHRICSPGTHISTTLYSCVCASSLQITYPAGAMGRISRPRRLP